MFQKILVANRGEIAVRIIRAAKELNIKTVAVYSEADRDSLHVRLADEAVCIGGNASTDSYLKIPNIMAAAEATGADAIHPGYGFLSENAKFAEICMSHDISFIGPRVDCIQNMGDKATARATAIANEVPVSRGTGILQTVEEAVKKVEEEIHYPVMIKATAGGGGKGMRIAFSEEELRENMAAAQQEALAAFGNGDVYIEKYIEEPRHVEVQILGDNYGNVIHLSTRDCSIQRRHQKMIEEAPAFSVPFKIQNEMGEAAVRLAKAIQYNSAGTLEFLVDKNNQYYFMEMNTRVQVEHTVTELVTGIDIIQLQIRLAAGEKLNIKQQDVAVFGHAIECRINAESPKDFLPSPGVIQQYIVPGGNGIRVDSHSYAGYEISPYYDSMIGKIIAFGVNRQEAIAKMKRALSEYVIEGVETTIPFYLQVLENENYQKGNITTAFMEENFSGK
ncbi:acetyl-CoA carboxylase biotin carboxylase subunit [Fusobacterium necrophorum BFTR-1]|uniref:acetyl-CoA carboxylase biotin carboxylase subunit n=1 Tax=Fusobacterium necrophorum TaxID=859 RepID=UPI00046131C8|nr:acetyl-CoA carboxylase biotin carboxylase subunit [Fusobacterium necrophorum]KDE64315.1 acetyl-CoA carboxylase biotin carboxylase subunit [Fusobacterium necrophorum BFTR-1]